MKYITIILLFFNCNNTNKKELVNLETKTEQIETNVVITYPKDWSIVEDDKILFAVKNECPDIFCPVLTIVKDSLNIDIKQYVSQGIYSLETSTNYELIEQSILSSNDRDIFFTKYSTENRGSILIDGVYFVVLDESVYIIHCLALEKGNNSFDLNNNLFDEIIFSLNYINE